jgi:hypothetical protein
MIDRFNFKKVFAMRKLILAVSMMFWCLVSTSRDFVGNVSVPKKVDLTTASLLKKSHVQSLAFIENKGQITDQHNKPRRDIQFKIAAAPGLNIFIGDGAIHYQFSKPDKEACPPAKEEMIKPRYIPEHISYTMYRMDVELINANKNAQVLTEGKQIYRENYFSTSASDHGANACAFNRITYKEVYPHIDWVLYMSGGRLKHEFVIRQGGKVSDIKLKYGGAEKLKLNKKGSLVATTQQGVITEDAPKSYDANGRLVRSMFVINSDVLSYQTDNFSGTLVIDPTLGWATYFGGTDFDASYGLKVDGIGNVYIFGETQSSASIATTGAYQTTYGGSRDAFLAKFDTTGNLLWATYFGGSGTEQGRGLAIDDTGNIYVTGATLSSSGIATSGAHQITYGGGRDAFLVKFNSAGTLLWGTYFGGSNYDDGSGVCVDTLGNVYVTGYTSSSAGISTSGAYQTILAGSSDAFLAKFTSNGIIQWSTYYGGSSADNGISISCDNSGKIYLFGATNSTSGIATIGAHQTTAGGGGDDAFLARFDASGVLQWATYYGGSGYDVGISVSADNSGKINICGYTGSTTGIATSGAYQTTFGGSQDAFLARFDSSGALQWGTYFGASAADAGGGMSDDIFGNIYLTGNTQSTFGIATPGAYQTTHGGGVGNDAYLAVFSDSGALRYSTYFGGSGDEYGYGIGIDAVGNIYLSGQTKSTSGISSTGAYQGTHGDGGLYFDAFLARLNFCSIPSIASPTSSFSLCVGETVALIHTTVGGIWSSSSPSVATVGSMGFVNSISAGTSTISYSVTNSCGTLVATQSITVNPSPSITLGSNPSVCRGDTIATLPYSATTGSPTSYTLNWSSGALAQGFSNIEPGGIITTVAGNGIWAFSGDGGPATNASFVFQFGIYGSPNGVVVDRFGNIFIADGANHRIRKVEKATGVISTIAGTGIAGYSGDGGAATAAEFYYPDAIDVDSSGNLYILDAQNYRIRRVNSSGIITTIAGSGSWGYSGDGGPATAAKLNIQLWSGLKSDNFGNLYICDGQNNRIRKVNSSGIISTIAGNGTYGYTGDGGSATNAQIGEPLSVAIDASGNLYISLTNEVVRKVDISGTISTVAGNGASGYSGDGGAATLASFNQLTGIAVDKIGNLYIADRQNQVVRRVNTSGIISTVAGNGTVGFSGDGGSATLAQLGRPTGIAVDTFGNLYVGENTNMRVRKVTINRPLPASPISLLVPVAGLASVYTATLTVSNGSCSSISYPISVAIDSTPVAGTISGSSSVSVGSSIALTNTTPGGTWNSGNTSIASVGSTGLVTGVAAGATVISYSVTNACGTAVATTTITVTPCPPIISTIAGNGTVGYSGDGGAATSGTMSYPTGVAIDNNGNVYIADNNSNRIRKVNTLGIITTIAGTGTAGFSGDGGPATSAQLNGPYGVAVDAIGNLYITDDLNYRIRKVSQTGIITTIAGNGTAGFSGDGGAATSGSINGANQITIDNNGNIFFADFFNNRIRKVSTSGVITTVAGNGTAGFGGDGGQATAGMLSHPAGVAIDDIGNIYIADNDNDRIRKVNSSGVITTIAGTGTAGFIGDGGAATSAQLSNPSSISVDRTRTLFFTDQNNQRLRKINTTGTITTMAGNGTAGYSGDGGHATSASLHNPYSVAIDGLGNLYIADYGNSTIRKIISTLSAGSITGASSVTVGSAITLCNIATGGTWSSSNPSLATVASTGIVTGVSPGVDTISYSVTNACGTAVATKVVTVTALSATACNGITTIAGNGTWGYSGDGGSATSAMLSQPAGVAKDNNGNVYISDQRNHCIRKVNTSGVITTFAGTGTAGFSGDGGPATSAQLDFPHALAVDAGGNLIIADEYNFRIRKVSTTGIISTIAGTGVAGYSGDGGPATSATFLHVHQIAIDNSRNIFFADRINNNIRKISAGGIISTVAGDGTHAYYGDGGPATAAAMRWPTGLAVDGGGNLYIADSRNQRVRFVNAAGIISTIAGNGTPGYEWRWRPGNSSDRLVIPNPLRVDIAGNLYIG